MDEASYPEYGRALLPHFMNERVLFVISSDFCHWGSRFRYQHKYENFTEGEIYKSIKQLDEEGMKLIESHSLADFQAYLKETKNTICGRNPI